MKKLISVLIILGLGLGILSAQEKRYALVIGNASYTPALPNPANDANDVAAALTRLGFTVDKVINGDLFAMEEGALKLKDRLSAAGPEALGLFYYAGHGIQSRDGVNYLIPVGTSISDEAFLKTKALSAQSVLDLMQAAGNKLNLIFLDACRDNPFAWSRSSKRGLSVMTDQPPGSIIVYATSAGSTASDGQGRNGVFTGQLLKHLETPGLDLDALLNRTAQGVQTATEHRQNPAIYKQFFGTAYLKSAPQTPPAPEVTLGTALPPGEVLLNVAAPCTLQVAGKTINIPAAGTYPIKNLPPGNHNLSILYSDQFAEVRTVTVLSGRSIPASFLYKPYEKTGLEAPAPQAPGKTGRKIEMVRVSGGSFKMQEAIQTTVKPFSIGKTEVTRGQFQEFIQATGYKTQAQTKGGGMVLVNDNWQIKADASWEKPYLNQNQDHPVVLVTWLDALHFANWLSEKEGLRPAYFILPEGVAWDTTANGYRLPTEAEWEFAARGGAQGDHTQPYPGSTEIEAVAWTSADLPKGSRPVAQKKPNALGLYDMAGNAAEWCWDYFQSALFGGTNPMGPSTGTYRVVRGGAWNWDYSIAKLNYRSTLTPSYAYVEDSEYRVSYIGFRLAKNP